MGSLCLSRKTGEEIVIGDDITVIVDRIERTKVRLRFKAPPSMRILRREILEKIARERMEVSPGIPT